MALTGRRLRRLCIELSVSDKWNRHATESKRAALDSPPKAADDADGAIHYRHVPPDVVIVCYATVRVILQL